MAGPITDPDLLAQLNGGSGAPGGPVTDEELIRQLEAPQPYSGTILPATRDQSGVHFDSNAGIVGMGKRVAQGIWSGVTAPGDAATGKLQVFDPETGMPTDEAVGRANELAGVIAPVNPAVRAGDFAIPRARAVATRPENARIEITTPGGETFYDPAHAYERSLNVQQVKPTVPTQEELRAAAKQGYDAVRDSGVQYSSRAVALHAGDLRRALETEAILEGAAPKTYEILRSLENRPPDSVVPISYLDAARKGLKHAGRDFNNPTDQEAARIVREGLDGFISRADPSTVVAGPAAEAGGLLSEARGNVAARKRSEKLTTIEENGERRALVQNSGLNADNNIRQRVASIVEKPKERAGYNPEEVDALEGVARGNAVRNGTRWIGNYLGGGGGLGSFLTTAGTGVAGATASGSPWGAVAAGAPLAAGITAKNLANRMTVNALRGTDEMIRMRSPLYQERLQMAGSEAVSPAQRAALIRALTEGVVSDQQQ